MADELGQGGYEDRFFSDINTRLRDLEEKQRLLKDRMVLIGESFVSEREKSFSELQEMKKAVELLTAENIRMKELLMRIGEGVDKSARKEELMILQRQFDILRSE